MAGEQGGSPAKAHAAIVQGGLEPSLQPLGGPVEALARHGYQILTGGHGTGEAAQVRPAPLQKTNHGTSMAAAEIGHGGHQLAAHRHAHFGSPGGGGRAQVGGVVDEGPVGLVAHGRHQRDHALGGGSHDPFVVEAPEVFQRPTAARHDDDRGARDRPGLGQGIEATDRSGNLRRARLALHAHRPDQNATGKAVRDAVEDIADDGAGGRGHHADHVRQIGDELLARVVEQALSGELAATLLQQGHEGAHTRGLHRFDDDLVGRLARKGCQLAGRDDLKPLFGADAHSRIAALPDNRVDLGLLVFEGEIAVAGGMRTPPARNLAADLHIAEAVLDGALERIRKFADRHFSGIGGGGFVHAQVIAHRRPKCQIGVGGPRPLNPGPAQTRKAARPKREFAP